MLPQRRMKFIGGSISSNFYILNSPERFEHIRQANKLAPVLCDLESDSVRENEEKKKRYMEAEENRRRESEDNQFM